MAAAAAVCSASAGYLDTMTNTLGMAMTTGSQNGGLLVASALPATVVISHTSANVAYRSWLDSISRAVVVVGSMRASGCCNSA
jgi:hypothetical protein